MNARETLRRIQASALSFIGRRKDVCVPIAAGLLLLAATQWMIPASSSSLLWALHRLGPILASVPLALGAYRLIASALPADEEDPMLARLRDSAKRDRLRDAD